MPYDFYVWGRRPDAADVRVAVAELAARGIWMIVQGEPGEGYLPVELTVKEPRAFGGADAFVAAGTLFSGCECALVGDGAGPGLTVLGASTWARAPGVELVCAALLGAALAKVIGGAFEDPQSGLRVTGAEALDEVARLADGSTDLARLSEPEILRAPEADAIV